MADEGKEPLPHTDTKIEPHELMNLQQMSISPMVKRVSRSG
jgi:hypothetical protein